MVEQSIHFSSQPALVEPCFETFVSCVSRNDVGCVALQTTVYLISLHGGLCLGLGGGARPPKATQNSTPYRYAALAAWQCLGLWYCSCKTLMLAVSQVSYAGTHVLLHSYGHALLCISKVL